MLDFLKHSKVKEPVTCPNCLTEQEVDSSSLSVFCKNCRARIDIKAQKDKSLGKGQSQIWKPKTKNISCPYCHSLQDVLATALSAYCKNCHQRITIKEETQADLEKPSQSAYAGGIQREIQCPHCGAPQKVPSTALSSFCPDCGNRINLQNYEIRGRFRGDLDTKGTIYISSDGMVEGNINTGCLVVAGKFKGDIIAEGKVEIKPTGKLYGKISAPALSASTGAIFVGQLRIGKKT